METTIDVDGLCRPLFRSLSMCDRYSARLDNNGDRRHSQSLDRDPRNSFVAAFDEYVYHENGFRRFKGVSSPVAQSPVKDPVEIHGSMFETDNESESVSRNLADFEMKIDTKTDEDFGQIKKPDAYDAPTGDINGNATTQEVTTESTEDSPSKQSPSKRVIKRKSLYDRERKPHYCTSHPSPEQPKTRPSPWTYGGQPTGKSPNKRKKFQTAISSINGDTDSSSSDILQESQCNVSHSQSFSSNSSDFDFDASIDCQESSAQVNDPNNLANDTGVPINYNAYSSPSMIPRPVRTSSFCKTPPPLSADKYTDTPDAISPCIGKRRSVLEKRTPNDFNLNRPSLTTTPTNGHSEPKNPLMHETSAQAFTSSDKIDFGRGIKLISVPVVEDGYPDPKPSSRTKTDLFNPRDFVTVDQHSLQAPESLLDNFDDLIDYLLDGFNNEMSKLRAIYRWIVSQRLPLNIKPGEIIRNSPMWYLYNIREKRASFSELFATLCRRAFIPCAIIHGVAKSVAYDVGDKVSHKRLKNSWNAVFIDGEWRFVHPYWARRSVKGYDTGRWAVVECDEFHKDGRTALNPTVCNKINDFFFLTDPDKFITKCFPEDPSWQLLAKPLTKTEYEDLAFLQPAFYQLNLQVKSHTSCVIHTNTGHVELTIGLPPNMSKRYNFKYKLFIHRDWEAEGEYDQILLDRYLLHYVQDDIAMFEIRFPVNGVYKLELHCQDRKISLTSDWICDYRLVCHEAMQDCVPLPVVPSIGWGLGQEMENSGLECLTHSTALINLDHENVTFLRFAIPKDKSISVEAVFLKTNMSRDELFSHVTIEQDSEHALVRISPPTAGEYALQIFVNDGEEEDTRKNVCNFLMHRTKIVEDPEVTNIRNRLIEATESGDFDDLSLWIARFIDREMIEERGELTKALHQLNLARIARDLKEAISRKDLELLERALNSASDTSIRRQLGSLVEEAEAVRSRLRRLKRLQHAVLELDNKTISEIRSYPKPPAAVHAVMAATFLLLGNKEAELKKWSKIQVLIMKRGSDSLKTRVAEFNINNISPEVFARVQMILSRYDLETVQIASIGAATFYQLALTMAEEAHYV